MATAAGIIITAGAITILNDMLPTLTEGSSKGVQVSGQAQASAVLASVNWRVIPATAVAALFFAGLESLNAPLAKGLAGVALLTTLIHPFGNGVSFIGNLSYALGYSGNNPSFSGTAGNAGRAQLSSTPIPSGSATISV